MPKMFESLMYAARRELVITSPYDVPDEPIQAALCASARRGVDTTVVFPARNDSWIVAAASHSYYPQLLDAGVKIYEYEGGLLHTKSMTVDGETTLIGSANIDRRSFELNFENNILFVDRPLTAAMRERQASYIARSVLVEAAGAAYQVVAAANHLEQHHRDARAGALKIPKFKLAKSRSEITHFKVKLIPPRAPIGGGSRRQPPCTDPSQRLFRRGLNCRQPRLTPS